MELVGEEGRKDTESLVFEIAKSDFKKEEEWRDI